MRLRGIFIILMVASTSTMIFPLFKPRTEISLNPSEINSTYININRPILRITTNIEVAIKLNITYFNSDTNQTDIISNNIEFIKSYKFEDLSIGFYIIELFSTKLGKVTLSYSGFYIQYVIIFIFLIMINIYYLYQKLEEI